MESINHALFLALNASAQPRLFVMALAVLFGEWLIWLVPLSIGAGWLWGDEQVRKSMLAAALASMLALLVNQGIGLIWPHPRPFMIGLGHTLVPHVADSSFPSDHLTLWWACAFSLALRPRMRGAGRALALLGIPMAWGRIYLGVHFPLDMAGAAAVAACCAWLAYGAERWYLGHCYRLAVLVHRRLFRKLTASGWLRR